MELLEKELGKKLTASQVAKFLGIDARLVRCQYVRLGGVRLGSRCYIFFERRLIDALSKPKAEQEQVSVDRSSEDSSGQTDKMLQNQERSSGMGGRAKKAKTDIERHNDIFG